MPVPSAPIRLGVVGLGRTGRFHLERWADSTEVRVVAAFDRDPAAASPAAGLCDRIVPSLSDLLAGADLDAVLLAVSPGERAALGGEVLQAGKHLVLDPPVAATVDGARSLYEAAEAAGRQVVVWSPWDADADFRAACGVLRSGLVGPPRLIRFERWEPMVLDGTAGALPRPLVYALDQLVRLADEPAESVYGVPLPGGGRTVVVSFRRGLRGVLTLHLAAATRVDHGWAIDAERGGYAGGRRWVRTAEGELYEVPAEPMPVAALEAELGSVVLGGRPSVSPTASLRLAALVGAVARSSMIGEAERVEPVI